jgi:2-C-methyl-D-erythritol 4-phosphate cytidylyltransferase/2-C-methyl-D-erythritol 2,4-cyclodiphosphate synthase
LVHDGARPLISTELVATVAEATRRHGAAIPVLALAETVKRVAGDDVVETVDRTGLATAQTPQGIRRDLLERAWASFPAAGPRTFTDEASLLEACRIRVHAVPGDPANIKVTVPEDLGRTAAALLGTGPASAGRPSVRVGFGSDEHPFGPGRPLALAGISIAGSPALHGHSDGDVALHAIADALLGACGLGDLGRLFPAGPETPRGAASRPMLGTVLERVRAAGYAPTSLDLTIVAARPRLAEHLDAMRLAVAELLGLAPERVNVKASSGNLEGWQGAGRGISATAVAVVESVPGAVGEARP